MSASMVNIGAGDCQRVAGNILTVQTTPSPDRTVYIMVGPSGGRPDFAHLADMSATLFKDADDDPLRRPSVVQLVADSIVFPYLARIALLGAVGRWVIHRVFFRGGWSVYIDAPNRDPIKIRCANQAEARKRAEQLAAELETSGVEILDTLRG